MMFITRKKQCLAILGLVFIIVFTVPLIASAETDIKINICDPDRSHNPGQAQDGNAIYSILGTPQVSMGENRELGTVRATGKPGIAVPVAEGQKVKLTLPVGITYMQIPNSENYKNYVEWPSSINGQSNQIVDSAKNPGVVFVSGSPRSLTVQVGNLDTSAPIMVLDFIFNKSNFSTVRLSPLLEYAPQYDSAPDEKISRLEFCKMLVDVSLPFACEPLISADSKVGWEASFLDLQDLMTSDLGKISPLLATGFVSGYPDGRFLAGQSISRAEAVSLSGKLFLASGKKAAFKDPIPAWAMDGINSAISGGIVAGYSDGTFQANRLLSKSEALAIVQNCLESYCQQVSTIPAP